MTKIDGVLRPMIFVVLLGRLCLAQQMPPRLRPITPVTSRLVQVPPFSYFGANQCDGDGNLYFHDGSSSFGAGRIFKLSKDGSTGSFFQLSGKFSDSAIASFDSFRVNADGEIFILASGAAGAYVSAFDQNGSMQDPLTLQVPSEVNVTDFALFDNNFIFVRGYYSQKNAKRRQGQAYQAIFAPSGELSRELSTAMADVDLGHPGNPTDGGIAIARGNLYFLAADQITVISPSGEIVRKLAFSKPESKAIASNIYVSGGIVVVVLDTISSDHQVSRRFLVLDEHSGELIGYSQPSTELNGADVCLTRDEEMTFLQVTDSKLHMVTARLR